MQVYDEMLKFMPLRLKDTKFHKDFLVFLCDFVTLWQEYESLRKT